MKKLFVLATAFLFFVSCSTDEPVDYSVQNDEEIQAYISENNLTAEKTATGLYYVIDEQGTGEMPTQASDRVKVIYTGYLTNGDVFDESTEGASFYLQYVIPGFAEGLTKFKEGGRGKIIIPAHLGYGSSKQNDIPAGSVIIFDIELVYVNYKTENDIQIQEYLTENNIEAQSTGSGLYYVINEPGTGVYPTSSDKVTVAYTGSFLDGNIFGESTVSGSTVALDQVIEGWKEGIPYFNEGSKGTLYIPSHLGYGNYYYNGIPGGSVLIFDIELKSVN
ncbi:FKBP-type peptidyl-prolyl cis-trans isomerase [Aestuariibaculum suncheonense]|uniref:Peptidyl-prolyl cis-trans isomerase n=1 Tax=Aestuariibaculum suncheonense TaxID=1028745 RepID=A0A8J6Q548_9FLAO|nr:FKBP-type peptidyl-prolyl cis-trans isomerase [Aestuariibaculum suncheonense]MBD0834562.1 FKBP-type peptidyl-prolyl cis-trans isomerase [Aestuariibaculum suncheonense]